jgi:hypothetical protein
MYTRVGFNTIMHYILEGDENNRWAGAILSTRSFVHTCRKEKTPRLTAYGHTGGRRSISTNAHKLQNHPMKVPMGDATLNSDNLRSIRSYAPIFGSIVSRYVLSDNAQVHLPIR